MVTGSASPATMLAGCVLCSSQRPQAQTGLTTELSAMLVFLLGGAVMYGYAELAVSLAILTSAVLAFKQPLHGLVEKIGNEDLYAGHC